MKVRKLVRRFFSSDQNLSLEHSLFSSSILVGLLICSLGSAVAVILSSNIIAVATSISMSLIVLVIYYFIRFKGIVQPFIVPILVLSFIAMFVICITAGGVNGPNMFPATVLLILALIVVPKKMQSGVIVMFVVFVVVLYLIEYYRPDLIIDYPSEQARMIDSFVTTLYSAFSIYLIIRFYQKQYNRESTKAEENEKNMVAMFDGAPFPIIAFNQTMVHFVNRCYWDYAGKEESEYGIEIVTSHVHPDDYRDIMDRWSKAFEIVHEQDMYYRFQDKAGEDRNLWCHAVPIERAIRRPGPISSDARKPTPASLPQPQTMFPRPQKAH